jgi:hypothetical protein
MDDLYADNPNNPISSRRQIIGDLLAVRDELLGTVVTFGD